MWVTNALIKYLLLDRSVFIEPVLQCLDDFIYCTDFQLLEIFLEIFLDHLVEVPQGLPQFCVEMVFHAVIGPCLYNKYRPGNF